MFDRSNTRVVDKLKRKKPVINDDDLLNQEL